MEHPDTVCVAILSCLSEAVRILCFLGGKSKGDANRAAEAAGYVTFNIDVYIEHANESLVCLACSGFMALRSRSSYIPAAVLTPKNTKENKKKERKSKMKSLQRKSSDGKSHLQREQVPVDPATRSEFQEFFKRIAGSGNKAIAILKEL